MPRLLYNLHSATMANLATNSRAPDASPPWRDLNSLFEAQARKTPAAPAIVSGSKSVSYGDLDARAETLARALELRAIGPESIVGVCVPRSPEMVVAMLAVLRAGAAYLPLDPGNPTARNTLMAQDVESNLVVAVHESLGAISRESGLLVVDLATITGPEDDELRAKGRRSARPENLAYAMFTSGSTGRPKAVGIPQRAVVNRLLWGQAVYPLQPADRVLQHAPSTFDFSVWEIFAPLIFGAAVVLTAPELHRNVEAVVALMVEARVTAAHFVPSALSVILRHPLISECKSLRYVFSGGEQLDASDRDRFFELLPDAVLYNQYGPTETCIDSTCWECRAEDRGQRVPIGFPIDNTQTIILDANLQPLPVGATGELFVAGDGLARGYLHRADLTAEKFLPHPFPDFPGERLYRTGDLARYRASGEIEWLRRADDQIKLRGFRIELGEVHAAVKRHPSVNEVVVSLVEVGGEARLVAYLVAAPVEDEELRSFVAGLLPPHMIPANFVRLPALPLLPSGKLDRGALPRPQVHDASPTNESSRDLSPTETIIARIWADVLKLEQVHADDDFFVLGGHSLLATVVVSRLREALDLDFPLSFIFESPTVGQLAGRVSALGRELTQDAKSSALEDKKAKTAH